MTVSQKRFPLFRIPIVLFLVIVARAFTGCSSSNSSADLPNDSPFEPSRWRIISIDGEPVPTDSGVPKVSLIFQEQRRFDASVGCNAISGKVTDLTSSRVRFTEMIWTEMWCEELVEREGAFSTALGKVERWELSSDGELLLSDGEGELLLECIRNSEDAIASPPFLLFE